LDPGDEKESWLALSLSAILICLSALTKYYGITLVPLLLSYSLAKERALGRWGLALLFPLLILFLYDLGTKALYGRGLFQDIFPYASNVKIIYTTSSIFQWIHRFNPLPVADLLQPFFSLQFCGHAARLSSDLGSLF